MTDLVACPSCGWETVHERCPRCGASRPTLEHCVCGQHTECPDGWHYGDDLPCSCTPDCALVDEATAENTSRMTYTISHQAYYWDSIPRSERMTAEIVVHRQALTLAGSHDGVHWEFVVTWRDLGANGPVAGVEMFDDSFAAFVEIPEFFSGLAELGEGAAPEDVVGLLDRLGFTDITSRERPADD